MDNIPSEEMVAATNVMSNFPNEKLLTQTDIVGDLPYKRMAEMIDTMDNIPSEKMFSMTNFVESYPYDKLLTANDIVGDLPYKRMAEMIDTMDNIPSEEMVAASNVMSNFPNEKLLTQADIMGDLPHREMVATAELMRSISSPTLITASEVLNQYPDFASIVPEIAEASAPAPYASRSTGLTPQSSVEYSEHPTEPSWVSEITTTIACQIVQITFNAIETKNEGVDLTSQERNLLLLAACIAVVAGSGAGFYRLPYRDLARIAGLYGLSQAALSKK